LHCRETAGIFAAVKRLPSFFGPWFGVAVAVGSMIGAGILRAPHDAAALLASVPAFLGVWVLGGLYALLGANAIAELGAMRPRSGGQYAIAHHAFGPFAAFAVGWNDWLSCCGAVAAVSIVLAEAAAALLRMPALALPLSLAATVAAGVVLWQGSRTVNTSQQLASAAKFVGFMILTAACLAWGLGHERAADAPRPSPVPALLTGIVLALQGVIFAYDGWVGIVYFGEEVHDPARAIPRALFGGVLAVMGVYLLLNVALVMVMPLHTIAIDPLPTATAATLVFGAAGETVVRLLVLVALPSGILANLGMGTRVAFSLGRDTRKLAVLGNATDTGAPKAAVLLSTVVALAFLATGTFSRVVAICSVLFVASYAVSFAAVFRMRVKEPATPRPWCAIGHPYTTGLVLAGSIAFLVGTAMAAPRDAVIAALLLVASYPLYRLLR
jgi:APA family basic amino acid/polyamine antiporter